MKISKRGLEFIIKEEGEILYSYRCQAGIWTIGVGHTGADVKQGMKITKEQSRELLRKDLKRFEDCVNVCIDLHLTQNQFDALVSLAFNIGCQAFKISTLRKKINAGASAKEIEAEFKKWRKGGGRVLPVLVARREREIKLFTRGQYE